MSMKGGLKETTGKAEEELGEAMHDTKMEQQGRHLRNEGRVENGKMPKTMPVGTEK